MESDDQMKQNPSVEGRTYIPNYVSLDTRATFLVASALLIAYAVACIAGDDFLIWLPGRRIELTIHLHGPSVWIACGAIASACLCMVSIVVDHYDRRDNEAKYKLFGKATLILAAALLAAAVLMDLIFFKKGTYQEQRLWRPWANLSFERDAPPASRLRAPQVQ